MIGNILDNTTELWMTKYIIGEISSSGGATLYKNPSDQTVGLLPIFKFRCYMIVYIRNVYIGRYSKFKHVLIASAIMYFNVGSDEKKSWISFWESKTCYNH